MKRPTKAEAQLRLNHVIAALELLHSARQHLRVGGAKNSADYVARAMKSAKGAENNARRFATYGD